MKNIQSALFLFILCLLPIQALAVVQPNGYPSKNIFDVDKANLQFDKISIKLSTVNLDVQTLNKATKSLEKLTGKAEDCVQETTEKISDIKAQIKLIFGDGPPSARGVDSKYLENQLTDLTQKQAKCRLFLIRANEAMGAYKDTMLSLQQTITFTRGETIFKRLVLFQSEWKQWTWPKVKESVLSHLRWIGYACVPLFLVSLLLCWQLQRFTHKKWRKKKSVLFLNTFLLLSSFILFGVLLISPSPFDDEKASALFNQSILILAVYGLAFLFYNYLFLIRKVISALHWYGFDLVFVKRLGLTVLTIYIFRLVGINVLSILEVSDNAMQLFEDLILLLSLLAMIYFMLILYHRHSRWFKKNVSGILLYQLIALFVVVLLVLDFSGFSILAVNAAYILFSLLLVSTLGTALFLGSKKAYSLLSYNPHHQGKLRLIFGYSGEPPFIEILLLKILIQLFVIIGMAFIFAQMIGGASYFIDNFFDYFVNGLKVGGIHLMPLQWLIGIVGFCAFSLFSRHIAARISRSQQYDSEEQKQVAIASIVLYVGFSLSVIIGLLLAGFSFTSLAIIAGALSVGIGLGLQSIVNNFFSGIILLIEKPIKAGDRIKIDDIEGFVKKVSVRSTQIVTPAQEDIIIPNSDLITHQVTNYMFSDKYWRVKCCVGVAYGSDTKLVSETLYQVGSSHPDVLKSGRLKPMVLFRSFGDSALMFELWCLIRDVNKKYVVTSELNYAIDNAFREHNITIAFPQQDVHVNFSSQDILWNKKEHDAD